MCIRDRSYILCHLTKRCGSGKAQLDRLNERPEYKQYKKDHYRNQIEIRLHCPEKRFFTFHCISPAFHKFTYYRSAASSRYLCPPDKMCIRDRLYDLLHISCSHDIHACACYILQDHVPDLNRRFHTYIPQDVYKRQVVASVMPEYKACEKWLRDNGATLWQNPSP